MYVAESWRLGNRERPVRPRHGSALGQPPAQGFRRGDGEDRKRDACDDVDDVMRAVDRVATSIATLASSAKGRIQRTGHSAHA